MELGPYHDFLIACVGASASFIGLLFVALSLVITRKGESVDLEFSDRRLAESAFTALANVFFVCLVALMPNTNIGYGALVMALIGMRSSWLLFKRAKDIRGSEGGVYPKREVFWIIASLLIYLAQAIYAWRLLLHPTSAADLNMMTTVIIILFGAGLVRSWELTGIRGGRKG
jgi:hypothetical protein